MTFIFFLLLLLASCAGKKGPEVPKTEGKTPPVFQQQEETSERRASNAIIEEGKEELEKGELDRALATFEESLAIDPANGVAYYYLAVIHFRKGEYDQAESLLEKAHSLLANQEEWLLPLEELKRDLAR